MIAFGGEAGADYIATRYPCNHIGERAGGNYHSDTTFGGEVGCLDFGTHTTRTPTTARATSERINGWGNIVDSGNKRGSRITTGISSIQAINIGDIMMSKSASTRLATNADRLSLSPTLISSTATASFSLIIDNDAMRKASRQGIAGIEVTMTVTQIGFGEQGLPDWHTIKLKQLLVQMHDIALHQPAAFVFATCHAQRVCNARRSRPAATAPEVTRMTSWPNWRSCAIWRRIDHARAM
jgi:hypothetical protein